MKTVQIGEIYYCPTLKSNAMVMGPGKPGRVSMLEVESGTLPMTPEQVEEEYPGFFRPGLAVGISELSEAK